MIKLRPYQSRMLELTMDHLQNYPDAAPILWACTGAGKSIVASALADSIIRELPGKGAVLVLAHRLELIEQNHSKLANHLKGSIYSAGAGKKDLTGQVIFAGIQSIRKQWHKLPLLKAVIIDEADYSHIAYHDFVQDLRRTSPNLRVVGMTATPYLGNGTWLHMLPDHRLFTGICAEIGIGELLRDGHLCPLVPAQSKAVLDASGIKVDSKTGDFAQGDLQKAVDVPELVQYCANEIHTIFADRHSVLVFCSGVEHAEHVASALGSDARVVSGDTPKVQRKAIIGEFKEQKFKYLVSVDVLSVGFDAPNVDGMAFLRPTKSPRVWVQMNGRGLRTHESKQDCLVADFTSNSQEFPPLDEIEGHPPVLKSGDAPVKICDDCFSIILAGLRKCPTCGHEFEFNEKDPHKYDANTGLLISGVVKNEDGTKTYPVEKVDYRSQITRSGAPALVVDYYAPGRSSPVSSEFLNLWHHSLATAQRDSQKWLRRLKNKGGSGVPMNIGEALARASLGALIEPKTVTVKPGSPYPVRFTI